MIKKIHIIGIGGSGLSAIALVLLERGYSVSGSDRNISPILEQIEEAGGRIFIGHKAENVNGVELVLRSSAVSESNVEVQAARQAGIPVMKRSDFLNHLISDKKCIAIAGTHGKTTTTAMAAWIFTHSGFDPSYIIGSSSINLGKNAHSGHGDHFIIEADEYDRMFLGLNPTIAAITSIEHDHPDCFPTEADFYEAFVEFALKTDRSGMVLVCADDPGCRQLLGEKRLKDFTVYTYGIESDPKLKIPILEIQEKGFLAKEISLNDRGGFNFVFEGVSLEKHPLVSLQIPGIHNVKNATCALAVATLAGIKPDEAVDAIREFRGTERRFEVRGEVNGVFFISDYAHHPTEINATLTAADLHYPGRRIWAVWQPHTFSRTKLLLDEFASSFEHADYVCVMDVYAARESEQEAEINSLEILENIRDAKAPSTRDVFYTGNLIETSEYILDNVRAGDLVIVLSAGDADHIINLIKNNLSDVNSNFSLPFPAHKFSNRASRNIVLAPYTSSRIGGSADFLIQVNSKEELVELITYHWENNKKYFLIGGGSNILVSDAGIRGTVLLNKAKNIEFRSDDDSPYVWSESGASLGLIARRAAQLGLSGLEWAAGIPGTIGGAVVGNAGAHGSDIAKNIKVAEILHLPKKNSQDAPHVEQWSVEQLDYSYRSSIIKRNPGKYIVLSVELGLMHGDKNNILDKMVEFSNYRKQTQPSGASIGSMFKNPPGDFAGRLIEKAGLKGFRMGNVEISTIHANFFINKGNSTASDVLRLIKHTQKTVYDESGVSLEMEIELVGEWKKEDGLQFSESMT